LNHQLERFNVYGKCKEQSTKNKGQQFSFSWEARFTQFITQVEQFFGEYMKRLFAVLLLIGTLALPAAVAARTAQAWQSSRHRASYLAAQRGVDQITAAQMRAYLSFIASERDGRSRYPFTWLDTTAKFIAMNLTRWGFKPAGDDGSYLQRIALRARSSGCCTNPG